MLHLFLCLNVKRMHGCLLSVSRMPRPLSGCHCWEQNLKLLYKLNTIHLPLPYLLLIKLNSGVKIIHCSFIIYYIGGLYMSNTFKFTKLHNFSSLPKINIITFEICHLSLHQVWLYEHRPITTWACTRAAAN